MRELLIVPRKHLNTGNKLRGPIALWLLKGTKKLLDQAGKKE
jgi:hypothetical protein